MNQKRKRPVNVRAWVGEFIIFAPVAFVGAFMALALILRWAGVK